MFKDFFYNFLSQCTYNHVESNPAMLSHDDRQHCNVVVSVAPLVDKNRSPMERQGKWVAESCADCGSIGRILHFWSSLNPLASWLLHLPAFLASNNQFAVTATKMCVTKLNTNIFTVPCDRLERTKGRGRCGFAKAINDWVHNRPEHGQRRTTRIEREFSLIYVTEGESSPPTPLGGLLSNNYYSSVWGADAGSLSNQS